MAKEVDFCSDLQDEDEARVEANGVRLDLDAAATEGAAVRADLEELRLGLPVGVEFGRAPRPLLDHEAVAEVRHELEVLLLLLHTDDLELLAEERLELLLQAEREC